MTAPLSRTVPIDLGARAYDVVIAPRALAQAGAQVRPWTPRGRAIVVADARVAEIHGAALEHSLRAADRPPRWLAVPPGEASKSFAELERLSERLLEAGLERGEAVIAFGGGVVGDLAGFAAAIVKRGAPYIQIPTTLLAQVDSSVGGKTAINAAAGKNLVGAFHQPVLVLADTAVLDTLPPRELRAGYAEIVKYAVIADPELFAWLERRGGAVLAGDPEARVHAVAQCVEWKAAIVAEDERESGRRALLNLGHTFGHAFEAEAGYEAGLLHGEAVAVGMVLAARYAHAIGLCAADVAERLAAHLARHELPHTPAALAGAPFDPDAILARMGHDKKNEGGRIRLVLPTSVGAARVVPEENPERLRRFVVEHLSNQ